MDEIDTFNHQRWLDAMQRETTAPWICREKKSRYKSRVI